LVAIQIEQQRLAFMQECTEPGTVFEGETRRTAPDEGMVAGQVAAQMPEADHG
jgi:hypothetical protein